MNDQPSDDRVRRLLDDAVSDVEPRPALQAIRARTAPAPQRSHRRGWLWAAGGAAAAVAATIAVVAVVQGTAPGPSRDPGPAGQETPSQPAPDKVVADTYFVGDTGRGPRLFDEPHSFDDVEDTAALDRSRLQAAVEQPSDPDYRSFWPAGTTVRSVVAQGDGPRRPVVVDLSGPDLEARPDGVTTVQARRAVQALAWTARTSPSGRVVLHVDGRPATTLLGVPVGTPVEAGSADDVLAQVQVTLPVDGDTVSDPITVQGVAATFEANVQWELKQGDTVVDRGFTTAEECCTLSPFDFPIRAPAPGTYTLVVHDEDPSGGEGAPPWQDTKQITVE